MGPFSQPPLPNCMMTPIKVPGKNNRDQRCCIVEANRGTKRPRPLGRPPKRPAGEIPNALTVAAKEPEKSAKQKSLKRLKSRRKMSALERLPTELLLKIFYFALNLDLPRSSPIITGKISSEHTYVQTIIIAFGPTWDHDRQIEASAGTTDLQKGSAKIPGNPGLQFDILRSRFATIARLLKAEETWLRKSGASSTIPNVKAVDEEFYQDYKDFITFAKNDVMNTEDINLRLNLKWHACHKIHVDVEIPNSLLLGPWASDMIQKFFWLIRYGARICWTESTSGEVALSGFRTAVVTANIPVLWMFHYLGVTRNISFQMLTWASENAAGDIKERSRTFSLVKNMYQWENPGDHRVRSFQLCI